MPTFAELKAKAGKAKDATVSTVVNQKDRMTSRPMKETNWDPYTKAPPPPPPEPKPVRPSTRERLSSNQVEKSRVPPPPVNRSSRPDAPLPPPPKRSYSGSSHNAGTPPPIAPKPKGPPPVVPTRNISGQSGADKEIVWSQISERDKQAFFSWLDEYFSRVLGVEIGPN